MAQSPQTWKRVLTVSASGSMWSRPKGDQEGEMRPVDSGASELPSLKSGWESAGDATLCRLGVPLESVERSET
jgi:hypothetical protein